MKPRNAREKEVVRLSNKVRGFTDAQFKWIKDEVVEGRFYSSGKKRWCTLCGHEFKSEERVCPHCGAKSKVVNGRHTTYRDFAYAQFLQVYKGWQVIRYVLVQWDCKKGRGVNITLDDVIQKWCWPGQPTITLGLPLTIYPWWRSIPYSLWGGGLSIKVGTSDWYREWMELKVYPRLSLLPVYRKHIPNTAFFADVSADYSIARIFSNPYFETLYKAGKTTELKDALSHIESFNKYWPSVRIALRHGYAPKNWSSYFDLLRMLKYLHKDMRSPHYIAPDNFDDMHAQILAQYRNRQDRIARRREEREALRRAEEEERRLQELKEANKSFASRIKKFAGLSIIGKDIVIRPLMTIAEFKEEGAAMNHCVFRLAYYKKPFSLILSARHNNGSRIETIEVDLHDFHILQCHGVNNLNSAFHDEILTLVNNNMDKIREMQTAKKKRLPTRRSQVVGM